ncbi:MAG: aspartate/glutamate racemase family protein [Steroidobacteraceae bacterium]
MSGPHHPVVGVIGGMGPEATVEILRRIVARTAAEDDQDHIHVIVESNPKIPSRIAHLIDKTGVDPTAELVRIARNLESAGATLLAMPCNTAHSYADAIRAAVGIPLLDMVDLTVGQVCAGRSRPRVGLLASTAVHNTGIYARLFAARGCTVVVPRRQDELMTLIRDVKRGGTGHGFRHALEDIASSLGDDVDVVVIACTELSVIADETRTPVPTIDALEVLTQAILTAADAQQR